MTKASTLRSQSVLASIQNAGVRYGSPSYTSEITMRSGTSQNRLQPISKQFLARGVDDQYNTLSAQNT